MKLPEITVTWSHKVPLSQLPKVGRSGEVYEVCKQLYSPGQIEYVEFFHVLLLNGAGRVLCSFKVSEGGVGASVVCPIKVFGAAVKVNARTMILVHNHPSGNLNPSGSDLEITRKLQEGGKLLEITVYDHIIMTAEGYYSFADEGLM